MLSDDVAVHWWFGKLFIILEIGWLVGGADVIGVLFVYESDIAGVFELLDMVRIFIFREE